MKSVLTTLALIFIGFGQQDSQSIFHAHQLATRLEIEKQQSIYTPFFSDAAIVNGYFVDQIKTNINYIDTLDQLIISKELNGIIIGLPLIMNYQNYISKIADHYFQIKFREAINKSIENAENASGFSGFSFGTNLKSKALERIFGSSEISLQINGSIEVDLSGRTETKEGVATSQVSENQGNLAPKLDIRQQFVLEGRIGDKLTILADQNSEAQIDLENKLKVHYKGYEDEVIQSIDAGNIDLSLPGTKFVTQGGKNKGLFGVKTELQYGNLNFVGIASVEQGKKEKFTRGGGTQAGSTGSDQTFVEIKDYDYIKYRFFFADSIFKNSFEVYSQPFPKKNFESERPEFIVNLNVFVNVTSDEIANGDSFWATAVANTTIATQAWVTDTTGLNSEGQYYTRQFRILDSERGDYKYDPDKGFFYISNEFSDRTVAISYTVSSNRPDNNFWLDIATLQSVGQTKNTYLDYRIGSTNQNKFLKLIKSENMSKNNNQNPVFLTLEKLHMKNVYNLGYVVGDDLQLKIYQSNKENVRPEDDAPDYISIYGLDRLGNDAAIFGKGYGDGHIDQLNTNLFVEGSRYLMFPLLEPFDSKRTDLIEEIDNFTYKEEYRSTGIYNYSTTVQNEKYTIYIDGKSLGFSTGVDNSAGNEISLGSFNILENSDRVSIGGEILIKGLDYDINYFTGIVTLKSARAILGKNDIEIEYERSDLFALDKRTLLGAVMGYRFSENAFIGATALYLKKSSLEEKVRIGQEPFENFIWDLNGNYKSDSKFLTRAINYLPGIETNAPSSFNFEAEFAQVLPNPNTKNNDKTGDQNGVAFIDDFEGAKRKNGINLNRRSWFPASVPLIINDQFVQEQQGDSTRSQLSFFNPFIRMDSRVIFDKEVNSRIGNDLLTLLNLAVRKETIIYDDNRNPITVTEQTGKRKFKPKTPSQSAWGGIMASNRSNKDLNNTRFLEVWVKWEYPDRGVTPRLNIDFGQISENYYTKDQVSNNTLGSELGRPVLATDIENGLFNESSEDVAGFVPDNTLQEQEDVGLDRLNRAEEISIYGVENPYDNWVGMDELAKRFSFTFKDGILENGEFIDEIVKGIPWRINGTEQNSQESGVTRAPDKEDIDLNNVVNRQNSYFHVEVDLPHDFTDIENSPYFVSFGNDAEEGWVLLQIPIKELLEKENGYYPRSSPPDLNNVNFIRMYLDQFDQMNDDDLIMVNFAQVEFVSSDWQTLPPKDYDDIQFVNSEIGVETDEIAITFLNSDENSGSTASSTDNYANYYLSPQGVEGDFIDNERTVRGVEQSMVIEINDLKSGQRAEILKQSKFIAQNLSFHNYKKLQMYMRAHQLDVNEVGGIRELPSTREEFKKPGSHKSYFYMKINTTETDFYEYRVPILVNSLEGVIPDKNNSTHQQIYWDETKVLIDLDKMTTTKLKGFEEKSPNGKKTYILYDDPMQPLMESYRAIGNPSINNIKFIMLGVYNADKEFEGKDRLLQTKIWVNELRATEVRTDKGSALRFAASTKIADVMTINANFETRDADFSQIESTSVNPTGLNTTENQSYTLIFNVDKFLPRNTGIKVPIRYFYRRSVTVPKFFQGTDVRTNYKTDAIGDKFQHLFGFGDYSDRIKEIYTASTSNDFSISLNKSVTEDTWYNSYLLDGINYNGQFKETNGSDVQNSRSFSTSTNHKVDYSYTFSRENYVMLFAWLGRGSFLDKISQIKVYYSPQDIKSDLALTYSKSERDPRFQPEPDPVVQTRSTRSFAINYNLTEEIQSTWSRNYKSNLDQVLIGDRKMNFYDLLENLFSKPFSKDAFGNDYNITNSFGIGYKPTLVNGLTTTFDYRANFSYSEDIIKQDAALSLTKSYAVKSSYSPKTLISTTGSTGGRRTSTRGRGGQNNRAKEADEEDEETDEEDEVNKLKKKDADEVDEVDKIKKKDIISVRDDEGENRTPVKKAKEAGGIKFNTDWINPVIWGELFLSAWDRTDFSFNRSIGNSSTLHLQEQPSLGYQFGFADSADVDFVNPNLRKFGGKIDDSYAYKNDFKLSSAVSITLDNSYKYSETIDPNNNNTFSNTYSVFETDLSIEKYLDFRKLDSLGTARPFSIYLPDWDIRISGVEQWPLISLIASRASLSHKRTGKLTTQYKNNQITANSIENYQYTISQDYKPLVRLQMDTKLGISTDISIGSGETIDFKSVTTGSRRTDKSFSLTLSYNQKGGFRWPFDFWPFNGAYIENTVNFSFGYSSTKSSSENYRDINGVANFVQSQFTNRTKIEPSVTYQFSKTVRGSAYYSNEITESIRIKKLTKNEFGIKVNLTIRN